MDIKKAVSKGAERLLFRIACSTCPFQSSCDRARRMTEEEDDKKKKEN